MTKRKVTFDSMIAIQIVVAVFLFTLGIVGIIYWHSNISQYGWGVDRLFGRSNNIFNMFMSVLEIVAGVIMFAVLFVHVKGRLLYWLTLLVAIFWIVEIVLGLFARGHFLHDFFFWINRLCADLIILLVLWLINRRYA